MIQLKVQGKFCRVLPKFDGESIATYPLICASQGHGLHAQFQLVAHAFLLWQGGHVASLWLCRLSLYTFIWIFCLTLLCWAVIFFGMLTRADVCSRTPKYCFELSNAFPKLLPHPYQCRCLRPHNWLPCWLSMAIHFLWAAFTFTDLMFCFVFLILIELSWGFHLRPFLSFSIDETKNLWQDLDLSDMVTSSGLPTISNNISFLPFYSLVGGENESNLFLQS